MIDANGKIKWEVERENKAKGMDKSATLIRQKG